MGKSKQRDEPGLYNAMLVDGPNRLTKTFSTLSFITVGDKYGQKPYKATRFAGKQFQTVFPKAGRTANTYFTKEFRVLQGKYSDTQPQRYLETQPMEKRKRGFLSGDARKRDLSMNATMSVILGDTYNKELKGQKKAKLELLERHQSQLEALTQQENLLSKSLDSAMDTAKAKTLVDVKRRTRRRNKAVDVDEEYCSGTNGPEFLYDIGRSADTAFCSRSRRDSWYEPRNKAQVAAWSNGNKVLQAVDKRLGGASLNLTSRDIGVGARELEEYTRRTKAPVEFEASPHSRRSILDQQLNRTCGALLPPFNGNSNSSAGPPGSTLNL